MKVVIDTNVPVVANAHSDQVSPGCVMACVQRLGQITKTGKLVLDDQWRIIREYQHNLYSTEQPGVGNAFLMWVLYNQANPKWCEQVRITPVDPDDLAETDFLEFPADPVLAEFDPSDRKFVAVALAHAEKPPILQAIDSKWWDFKEALSSTGVEVNFICEEDIRVFAENKAH